MYIVNESTNDISRYIALNEQQEIIAYMLIKKGMNEGGWLVPEKLGARGNATGPKRILARYGVRGGNGVR